MAGDRHFQSSVVFETHGTCAIYFPGGFWSFSSKEDINFKGIVHWFWKKQSIKIMTLNSECCRGTYCCPNTWRMIGSMTMEHQYFGWGRVMRLWQSLIILGYQRKREGINNQTNKQSLVSGKHQHSSPEVPERIPQGIWVLKWLTLNIIESDAKIVSLRICPKNRVTHDLLFCSFQNISIYFQGIKQIYWIIYPGHQGYAYLRRY